LKLALQFTDFNAFSLDSGFPDSENCRALGARALDLTVVLRCWQAKAYMAGKIAI
jgi:hypothetical protein